MKVPNVEMRRLATPRLALEPLQARHAPEMFLALVDPELYRFMSEGAPQSVELLAQRYASLESRASADGSQAWLNWIVRVAETGVAVGFVQATAAMIGELRERHGVHRFRANVDPRNAPSVALLRTLGFHAGEAPAGSAPGTDLFFYRD